VNREQAELRLAELVAAFPFPQIPRSTVLLWTAELGKLDDEAAADAVQAIVDISDRWPTIKAFRVEYAAAVRRRAREFAETHGVEEESRQPPLDLAENARRAQALLERIGKDAPSIDPPLRHTDEELAAAYGRARRAKDEAEQRRAALIRPTNENGPDNAAEGGREEGHR
jgi:hypothetical protein